MKKKILIIAGILLLCLLYFCLFPIKHNIDRECEASLLNTDSTGEGQKLTVKIKGKYSFYLFQPDTFRGTIEIEGFPETSGEVTLRFDHGTANLVYHHWDRYELHSQSFGLISANFGLKDFIILKEDTTAGIDLSGNGLYAIISKNMDIADVEAFRLKLLEEMQR